MLYEKAIPLNELQAQSQSPWTADGALVSNIARLRSLLLAVALGFGDISTWRGFFRMGSIRLGQCWDWKTKLCTTVDSEKKDGVKLARLRSV
ncbi:hypothetical protein PoB_004124500 [Plakobranchus ocellatus]|uniref:Uncharacterized protein n=1 Tax=Plakobranchus ocellatus TaxID=259542 RepID=A0AAV4B2B1_9GAST|nr:hypothetical protein PoB_004124500 [Plakobranchus ocellatus]